MEDAPWKKDLRKYFDDVKIIERAKSETLIKFNQFCEFVAEPAFETLQEGLRIFRVKSVVRIEKNEFIDFSLSFPGTKADNFHYRIVLPRNSYELKLILILRGRRGEKEPLEEKREEFMKELAPPALMKLDKELLMRDVIKHYKDYNLAALAFSPD